MGVFRPTTGGKQTTVQVTLVSSPTPRLPWTCQPWNQWWPPRAMPSPCLEGFMRGNSYGWTKRRFEDSVGGSTKKYASMHMNQAYRAVLFTFLVQAIAIPSFFLPSDLVHPKFQVCYCPSYDGPVDGSVVACDDAPSASCEVNSWVWSARSKSLGCPKRMVFWIQIYRLPLQRGLEARVGTVVFFNRGHRIHSAGWCGLLLAPSCLRLGI